MTTAKLSLLFKAFRIPLIVLLGLCFYILFSVLGFSMVAMIVVIFTIGLGSFGLFKEAFEDIKANQFALDYIAILAIIVSLITKEFLVGAVIAFMLSTGRTLEDYGANQARKSLSLLADRIPHDVLLEKNESQVKTPIAQIKIGDIIVIRKGEVIPLDGELLSITAILDESSLTGEAYPVEKVTKDLIRSGTVNVGDILRLQVTREEANSTYNKIIKLVESAEKEKAPLVRLADKYSVVFTIITFIISGIAFLLHHNLDAILAVLVVATPCPLILATPIALLGGVNAAAKKRIIIKKLASIEILSRVTAIIFDKTGTITLGKPQVTKFDIQTKKYSQEKLLSIAESIERNSLHPLAKAVIQYAKDHKANIIHADNVKEIIGKGISGVIDNKTYTLSKLPSTSSEMIIGLYEGSTLLGTFSFVDEIKKEAKESMRALQKQGLTLALLTGDKQKVAEELVKTLSIEMTIQAEAKPEDKATFIENLKTKEHKVVAMVGDGINDAPALALADVGMVFSNEEQTAASEAADIVFLGGDFSQVMEALHGAKYTLHIATQSILWGIGLSIGAMIFAALGLIPPIWGAGLQEAIDVAVILNALRAAR